LIEAEFLGTLAPNQIYFAAQTAGFNPVANRHVKFFEVDGLADEIVSATTQSGDGLVHQNVSGDHDDDRVRLALSQLAQHVQARTIGEVNVEQDAAGVSDSKAASPAPAVAASIGSNPQPRKASPSDQRIIFSSSTTRILSVGSSDSFPSFRSRSSRRL
jgi:hypothetical protein